MDPKSQAQSEVRTTACQLRLEEVCYGCASKLKITPNYCAITRIYHREAAWSLFNYPKWEIEDPKTGQRKKLDTGEVSCTAEG